MFVHVFTGIKYWLLCGKEYTVGRKDTDIVVPGDQSVSRAHAVIKASHTEANIV